MDAKPLVSVVMPTYNNADFIGAALDSCLSQTYNNLEILVIDDGSTDNTRDLISSTYGETVRYIYQENAGPAAARNRGIDAAQGTYIKFLDSDDVILPQHIAQCVQIFETEPPHVAVVYTRFHYVDADGKRLPDLEDPPLLSGDVFCEIIMSNGVAILTSTTLVRREACLAVGCFDDRPDIRGVEDWDFYIKLAGLYEYRSVDDASLLYRWHGAGLSANPILMARGRLATIKNLGTHPRLAACYTPDAYKKLLAGRHHVYAMALWQTENLSAATSELEKAIQLTPQSRAIRRLHKTLLMFRLPFRAASLLNRLLEIMT